MGMNVDLVASREQDAERCVLVGLDLPGSPWNLEESLDELQRLAESAGAVVVGRLIQSLKGPDPATYLGSGKVEELKALAEERVHVDMDDGARERAGSHRNNSPVP